MGWSGKCLVSLRAGTECLSTIDRANGGPLNSTDMYELPTMKVAVLYVYVYVYG